MEKTAKTETTATKVDVTRSAQTEPVGSDETRETSESTVLHTLQTLREDIDRAFERVFHSWPTPPAWTKSLRDFEPLKAFRPPFGFGRGGLSPRAEVSETPEAYEIAVEIPGVEASDITVALAGNRLTVKGQKRTAREKTDRDYYLAERSYGAFARGFTLPDDFDPERIEASYKAGVLTVRLPRSKAKDKPREIPVKAA